MDLRFKKIVKAIKYKQLKNQQNEQSRIYSNI